MTYCESCGHELRAEAAFCQACGAKVVPSSTAAPAQGGAPPGVAPGVAQGYPAATASPPPYAGAPAAGAYAATPYGAAPVARSAGGMSGGVWLVIVGAILSVLFTIVSYGRYSYPDYNGWDGSVGLYAWRSLINPGDVFYDVGSWGASLWFTELTLYAAMVTTVLCIIAAVLALLRGTAGVRVSGGLIRGFGIAAAVASVLYIIAWATYPDYSYIGLTDIAGLVGNILIIVGGSMMGRAPAPPVAAWTPPTQGSGLTY